ncbi:MAG: cell division protein DivIC [Clostridiales bacterium]|nr:cell division protein DivIC [Clostridiales bacterium]
MSKKTWNQQVRKKRRGNLIGALFIASVLCSVVAYKKVDLYQQEAECQKKLAQLEADQKEEEQRTEEIDDYKAYVQSKEYIEKEARDKLGLTYPDEIVFEAEDEN